MSLRLGELCAGYNGLGMAVEEVFGATPAWFSEYDAAPSKILAHHYPDVPNYGDMTAIDWAAIEHADIISGGTPCQDLSAAGKRKGMTEGTRSNLWVQMREAIAIQRPKYVVWENVRGAYSATAASDLEQCPGCLGGASDGGVVLRALGRVLGDLSDLGYDCQWRGLRAGAETNEGHGITHVGSCHARFRVFVLAANTERLHSKRRGINSDMAGETGKSQTHGSERERNGDAPNDSESTYRGDLGESQADHPLTNPNSGDDDGWLEGPEWESVKRIAATWSSTTTWGEYEPAIRRWEFIIGRPVPRPTERTGRDGGHRLSPMFCEWMMGLPAGWVTAVPGVNRNAQLKALGNGVVPQQAAAALRDMLAAFEMEKAA